jgi:hypothetical protein
VDDGTEEIKAQSVKNAPVEQGERAWRKAFRAQKESEAASAGHSASARQPESCIAELFRTRTHFCPFSAMADLNSAPAGKCHADMTDAAQDFFTDCVMLKPCDIVRLQQENWQVGRSSFLQHGFYQHRHLLLGVTADGTYVLGVPGVQNPQEQYMAEMFGFGKFRRARMCERGRVFGYWCRELRQNTTE